MNYFYNEDDNNNDSTINTLLSYYKSNNDKITELNTTNSLLKREVASLMSKTFYSSILTNISESDYHNITKYINKTIKRGDEKYKTARDLYNCVLSELQKISTDIKSIINITTRLGGGYRTIAFNIYFSLNDNEYELYVPMLQQITIEDVFYQDYIDMDVNEFQLYIHSSKCSWTRIWTGIDIGQIPDDILKGDKT
jgi:hypothetical protein